MPATTSGRAPTRIESERSGYALELAVDFVRMASRRGGFGAPGGPPGSAGAPGANTPGARGAGVPGTAAPPAGAAGAAPQRGAGPGVPGGNPFGAPAGPVTPVPAQDLAEASKDWATGTLGVRLGDFMIRPHQKWTITSVPDAGGYPGAPYFKITIAGTERAWRQPLTRKWWRFRSSPAHPSNSGVSTS